MAGPEARAFLEQRLDLRSNETGVPGTTNAPDHEENRPGDAP
jgi:hypothetical protein